jgi:hypothetical protein
MADRALESLDLDSIRAADPRERAHRIVDAVARILRSDAAVFRELLAGWSHSGRVLAHDPTRAVIECLQDAAGHIRADVDLRRYGEVMAAGLVGTIHQWTAGRSVTGPSVFGRTRWSTSCSTRLKPEYSTVPARCRRR